MFNRPEFDQERALLIGAIDQNAIFKKQGLEFVDTSNLLKYAYIWNWMGLPIIQMPEDLIKVQEIIFETKPDVIIETGVAWGGSLLFYASVLKSLGGGSVIGIDITIPEHNRRTIMNSVGSEMLTLIEGSSISEEIFEQVTSSINHDSKVLLILDSHHTHAHVLAELELWSPLVKNGSYIIVCDTIVEFISPPPDRVRDWAVGNNPSTALASFLSANSRFSADNEFNKKSINSFHPGGFIRAIG